MTFHHAHISYKHAFQYFSFWKKKKNQVHSILVRCLDTKRSDISPPGYSLWLSSPGGVRELHCCVCAALPSWQLEERATPADRLRFVFKIRCLVRTSFSPKCVQQLEFQFKLGGEVYFKSTQSRSAWSEHVSFFGFIFGPPQYKKWGNVRLT